MRNFCGDKASRCNVRSRGLTPKKKTQSSGGKWSLGISKCVLLITTARRYLASELRAVFSESSRRWPSAVSASSAPARRAHAGERGLAQEACDGVRFAEPGDRGLLGDAWDAAPKLLRNRAA